MTPKPTATIDKCMRLYWKMFLEENTYCLQLDKSWNILIRRKHIYTGTCFRHESYWPGMCSL